MGDGHILWYRKPMDESAVANQIEHFRQGGIVLENMNSHRITMIDPEGDQVPTTRAALVTELAGHRSVSFQLWINRWTDVYCRFRHLSASVLVQEYSLNGLTVDERERVLSILWETFRMHLTDSEALIVDLYDRTEMVDWDSLVENRTLPTGAHPDLVALRQESKDGVGWRHSFQVVGYEEIDRPRNLG